MLSLTISPTIVLYIVGLITFILAIIIVSGKGDFLIAGYNTASAQEKANVNIKRLRLLISSILGLATILCTVIALCHDNDGIIQTAVFGFILATIIMLILANTWAKRK